MHIKRGELPHREYLEALTNELDERRAAYVGVLQTIYIGGGTPSLWEPACLAALLTRVRERYEIAPGAEITLEVNPIDCTPERLAAWRAAGCNRLSIGVQALDQATLAFLERGPHHGDGAAAVANARAAGFENVSVDFILGAGPTPSLMAAIATLAPHVTHMSVYELTIEDGTRFGRRREQGRLPMATDDVLADTFTEVHDLLTGMGFLHYEISSYARPGFTSRHNAAYWSGRPFLGIGVGAASFWRAAAVLPADAQGTEHISEQTSEQTSEVDKTSLRSGADHSFFTARRDTNLRSTPEYLRRAGRNVTAETQQIEEVALERELLWLALRTQEGASVARLARLGGLIDWLIDRRLATLTGDRLIPTLTGYLFANQVAQQVLLAPFNSSANGPILGR